MTTDNKLGSSKQQEYRVVSQTTHTIHKQNPEGSFEPLDASELEIFTELIGSLRAAKVLGENSPLSDLHAVRIIEVFATKFPQIFQKEV